MRTGSSNLKWASHLSSIQLVTVFSFFPALKVHCSKECRAILDKLGGYTLEERGYVSMKVWPSSAPFHILNTAVVCYLLQFKACRRLFHFTNQRMQFSVAPFYISKLELSVPFCKSDNAVVCSVLQFG